MGGRGWELYENERNLDGIGSSASFSVLYLQFSGTILQASLPRRNN
jgi:hypothetical protein